MSSPPVSSLNIYRPDFTSDMAGYGSYMVCCAQRDASYRRKNLFRLFAATVGLNMLMALLLLHVQLLGVVSSFAAIQWSGLALCATSFGTVANAPTWGHVTDGYGCTPVQVRTTVDESATRSHLYLVVAVLLAVMMVLVANEPVIRIYIEKLGEWLRRRM
jgi:hypothetical protein